MTINVENDAMLGRNNDSIYATKFYVMQKQIDDLQQENKQLKEVIDKAIEYNKELSEMYDIGSMERSNADTNLLILGDIKTIDILKEASE